MIWLKHSQDLRCWKQKYFLATTTAGIQDDGKSLRSHFFFFLERKMFNVLNVWKDGPERSSLSAAYTLDQRLYPCNVNNALTYSSKIRYPSRSSSFARSKATPRRLPMKIEGSCLLGERRNHEPIGIIQSSVLTTMGFNSPSSSYCEWHRQACIISQFILLYYLALYRFSKPPLHPHSSSSFSCSSIEVDTSNILEIQNFQSCFLDKESFEILQRKVVDSRPILFSIKMFSQALASTRSQLELSLIVASIISKG